MRLATRLRTLEHALRPDVVPRFRIVLEEEDGTWHDGYGNTIDPATVGRLVRIVRLVRSTDNRATEMETL